MITVRLVIGLPGSGKTTWAEKNCPGFYIFNDPGFECSTEDIEKALKNGKNIVITDPYFCYKGVLASCEKLIKNSTLSEVLIEKFFFMNEPDICLKNATSRPNKAVSEFITQLAKSYNPPSYAIPCWRSQESCTC